MARAMIRLGTVFLAAAPFAYLPEAVAASDRQTADLKIGVYQSEANAAEYKGIHQAPLTSWLEKNGYAFEVLGDPQAADAGFVEQFAAVIATSCYIVPDSAASGLARYVRDGGQLLWIDGPAHCRNGELLAVLGIDGSYTYRTLTDANFRVAKPDHFICGGAADFRGHGAGNPALKATGKVLATWAGADREAGDNTTGKDLELPAIVVTESGRGRAVLLNWVVWLTHGPEARTLVSQTVEYLLAERLLQTAPFVVRPIAPPAHVLQPEAISLRVRLVARSTLADRRAILRAVLVGSRDKPTSPPVSKTSSFKSSDDGVFYAEVPFALSTEGLPDGLYHLAIQGSVGDGSAQTTQIPVRLYGEEAARLAAADVQRAAMLGPLFRGALGDYDAEPRTKEGRVDIPRLLDQIEAAHMNMYDFLIWHAKTDWEDFRLFLPEAQKRGLKVWITLAPPSEPPPSQPFGLDYVRWAEEIGKLSKEYDNLAVLVIDDFWSGANHSLFTPGYVGQIATALREQNPRLAFLPTVYWSTIGDEEFLRDYRYLIDGIVFPYADLESTEKLPEQLAACRKWLGPTKLLLINVYASGSSGTRERGLRTAEYMRSILSISRQQCDGIRICCLPKDDFDDYRFRITAELYAKWHAESKDETR
ncbi:MAG: hypothetical protein ABIP48_28160 [Planctomycetota bacterium]